MTKYYAVRVGRKPGIYYNWEDCKAQTDKFSGAVYKSFSDEASAEKFYYGDLKVKQKFKEEEIIKIYIDGSYNVKLHTGGYGCVVVDEGIVIEELYGDVKSKFKKSARNIACEATAVLKAIVWAVKKRYKKVILYYDYTGLEYWVDGTWSAKTPVARAYLKNVQKLQKYIVIDFQKVKAHSGNKYNERADELAKKGAKIK